MTNLFLREVVTPKIAEYFPEESNNIAEVLGRALLWACYEPSTQDFMCQEVRDRVREGYDLIKGDHPVDYNPVEKVPVHVYRIENTVHIDELTRDMDQAGDDGPQLNAAQGEHAHREQMASVLLQLHRVNQRCAELSNQVAEGLGRLQIHMGEQFRVVNRNVSLIARGPVQRVQGGGVLPAIAPTIGPNNLIPQLSPHPRSLNDLWSEYMYGIGGQKPAKDFTHAERGADRHRYCRRKLVWDCVSGLVRAGYTAETAMTWIRQCYGHNQSVTNII